MALRKMLEQTPAFFVDGKRSMCLHSFASVLCCKALGGLHALVAYTLNTDFNTLQNL